MIIALEYKARDISSTMYHIVLENFNIFYKSLNFNNLKNQYCRK